MYKVFVYQLKQVFDKNFKLVRRWYKIETFNADYKNHAISFMRIRSKVSNLKVTLRREVR